MFISEAVLRCRETVPLAASLFLALLRQWSSGASSSLFVLLLFFVKSMRSVYRSILVKPFVDSFLDIRPYLD